MKKYQYLLGLCIAALLMPVLSSCEDDSLFFRTGSMSKLAFTVSTADDNGGSASTRGVVHVFDSFVDEDGDTLYLACKITDMDQPAAADSAVTRATPISASSTNNTLASVYGQFKVSAYKDGKVSRPLKETDEDGNELTNAKSYVGVTFSARTTTGGTQQTDDDNNPVWELTSGGSDYFYWPKNGSLTFYTYAPTTTVKSGPTWTGLTPADNFKDDGVIEFDYTVPSNVTNSTTGKREDAEAQPDILVSSVKKKRSELSEYEESTDTKYVVVPLKFYHALCAVEFKANASTASDDLLKKDVTVTSVSLGNLKGSGTCTFDPSATTGTKSADYISWDFTDVTDNAGNYSQTFNFKNDAPEGSDLQASIGTAAQTFMLIPQTVGGGSTATTSDAPEASITLGYTTSKGTAKTKSVDLHKDDAYTWKAGKKYTYYLTGSLASLTLDGSLLTWGMADAPLGLRHYVLKASKNELTFDDLFAEQTHTFDVLSYYYTDDADDGTTRTAVNCKVEYQDGSGNWKELNPNDMSIGAYGDFYASVLPCIGSIDDASATPAYSSLSHLYDATLDDALTEGTGMTFALSEDRNTSNDLFSTLTSISLDELVFTDDATEANGWDLSYCSVGGEYSASNYRNTANCYVVKHPGSYKFPLVYGNAIKNGSVNASAYSTSLTSAGNEGAVLQNFVNFLGLKVGYTYETKVQDNGKGNPKTYPIDGTKTKVDDKTPGYVLPNINNIMLGHLGFGSTDDEKKTSITAGAEKNLGGGVKIYEYTYLKAKLLWQDEPGMISNVKLVGVKDHLESASISFETADASTLKQCNALIGLYVDADKDNVLDDGEPIVWSWHIWVTDADLSDAATYTVTGPTVANTNSLNINCSGSHKFMPRDLGECDMVDAVLKTLTSEYAWMDGMSLRISQVEGDARPQIITIHQPGKEIHPKPYAPLYQWGRKDPFSGWNINTRAAKTLYDEANNTVAASANITGGHYSSDADRVSSIAQTIRQPLGFKVLSTTSPGSTNYTLYYNFWNNNINHGQSIGPVSITYLGSPIKTIYDPCPYGYRVPEERAFLAFDPANTWRHNSGAICYGPSPTFVAVAKTSIPDGAVVLLDADGAENERMIFPYYGSRYSVGLFGEVSDRQTSSLGNTTQPLNLGVADPRNDNESFLQTTSELYGDAVRPVRE